MVISCFCFSAPRGWRKSTRLSIGTRDSNAEVERGLVTMSAR
uniref:Uncharacterized protein n=1 Tax=Manihot esculenta TaxID=3983 RepID=A0A2C9VEC2_MANES